MTDEFHSRRDNREGLMAEPRDGFSHPVWLFEVKATPPVVEHDPRRGHSREAPKHGWLCLLLAPSQSRNSRLPASFAPAYLSAQVLACFSLASDQILYPGREQPDGLLPTFRRVQPQKILRHCVPPRSVRLPVTLEKGKAKSLAGHRLLDLRR